MSIIIQKKKLLKTDKGILNQRIIKFERDDNLYKNYIKTYDNFLQAFQKSQNEGNLHGLKHICEKFYQVIKNNDNLIADLAKQDESLNSNPSGSFLLKKTSDITNFLSEYLLMRENLAVALNNPNLWKSPEKLDKIASDCREITFLCLKVLKLFSMVNSYFALTLSNKPKFAMKMLELTLQNPKVYFKQAMTILEALLAVNSNAIPSNLYHLVHDILRNLSRKYFSRFSRIIALMILEPTDKMAGKEFPFQFSESKITKMHNFLLSVPKFLENCTIILEYLQQIMTSLISCNPTNIEKILTDLTESNAFRESGLSLGGLRALLQQSNFSEAMASEILTPKWITKIVIKKSNITEILFILSNLLSSKRKVDVQDKLIQIGFFEKVLSPLFDILFHSSLELDSPENQSYDDDYFCNNPLITTRIQLLRIIINICDRDSSNIMNKNLFLSTEEINLLKEFTTKENNLNDDMITKNIFENVQEKGFLHKIILLFEKVHPNSTFSFWLASCIESFLRGFYTSHQIFVANTGMLYRLVKQIVTNEITRFNNIQISYDLLGEIIKFNKPNIILLEKICVKFNWIDKLSKHSLCNVVDSNVFFRSLWLSLEKLKYDAMTQKREDSNESYPKICEVFKRDSLQWFALLVETMEPTLISQDNICCVNTSLIMAIFAEENDNLESYLESLLQINSKGKANKEILENYRNVLSIWHKYYISKTKDCFSLQYTCTLPFYRFVQMKEKIQKFLNKHLQK